MLEDFLVEVRKYTDEELVQYMRKFLRDNDQLPPQLTISNYFDVAPNGVNERLLKLEKKGIFQRNAVNKIMFARSK